MIYEPQKPNNYVRDKVIIVVLTVIVVFTLVMFKAPTYVFVPTMLFFYYFADGIWFKEYNRQKSEFEEQMDTQTAAEKEKARVKSMYSDSSSVNENIAKYKQQQREKRAKAEWWQFWI
jgi:Ca2+/Na+ antiporter